MITVLVALCLFTSAKPSNIKEIQVQKVKRGENVSIKCDKLSSDKNNLVWFKQSFGKAPQWVGRGGESSFRPDAEFNDGRLSTSVNKNLLNLNIKEIKEQDTGTYFCAKLLGSSLHFGSGTLLVVEAEEMKRHPPTLTVMENGESLTLQCSVQAFNSSCEEQSVYWFRNGSGESYPGIIYTHGDGSDECKKSSEAGSPTQSCVYTLPKRKLTTSDNGTFYCAVAACGQILFSNGTEVKVIQVKENCWIVFVLTTSNTISIIVIMVLTGVLLKERKGASNNHPNNTNQADDEDVLNYAAVSFAKKPSSSRTSRDKHHEDVYSQVKIK
ncbi:immunoglobulin alpha-2 heavy chain-like isoform X3 [Pangasianodon hypophthalmus]|uniref:immunoglobulin alpha-2 heavy chain-like isoform X3 n=1 Tax=Pangasianodon hypophthalmus TaxID=310915 RepID=UPI0023073E76|nr:immunoglobulin alpha-2 heavy chain-like isoform X3 [Pangasianodon hypophthalmus]